MNAPNLYHRMRHFQSRFYAHVSIITAHASIVKEKVLDLGMVHTVAFRGMNNKKEEKEKDPHAVGMAKRRLEVIPPERRSEIARNAARARWAKRKKTKKKGR